ncbi:hypothetical protein [Galbitalea soli]|uniref:PKD domain-containing protein n=1 Tax=Galbitalea soli TaxID=1268042 RepID=A0A7C9PMN2_9MICO|nr:hypothetical protein [Galbitalea soli]NEM90849.1 hypothetical protein [Galbitalea soli]NYJ31569.1 hypothetical protein [Galbitalea soli]
MGKQNIPRSSAPSIVSPTPMAISPHQSTLCLPKHIDVPADCANNPKKPQARTVTLHDLATFKPEAGIAVSEPGWWAALNLPANFYALTPSEIEKGTLLKKPAEVHFYPVAWHWNYGDGTTTTTSEPGASWAAQGLPDLTTTPTSHRYRARGTITATLTVDMAAEYRFDNGDWIPVSGTIAVHPPPIRLRIYSVHTVLVNPDCPPDPRGPGC